MAEGSSSDGIPVQSPQSPIMALAIPPSDLEDLQERQKAATAFDEERLREYLSRENMGLSPTQVEEILGMKLSDTVEGDLAFLGESGTPESAGISDLEKHGSGSFGDVYRRTSSSEEVLKILSRWKCRPENEMERFACELKQCYFTTLIKPAVEGREQHVVSFLGYSLGQAPALRFSFEGDTVVKFLKSREFDLRERLDLMLQIIEAVEDLHTLRAGAHSAEDEPSMYCVHCDLKPENIMIKTLSNPGLNERAFVVRLVDFGESTWMAPITVDSLVRGVKQEGRGLTPEYCPPERLDESARDHRGMRGSISFETDIFALGALMLCLFTAHEARLTPFPMTDKGEISDQYLRDLVAKWGPRSQHPTLGYIHRYIPSGHAIPMEIFRIADLCCSRYPHSRPEACFVRQRWETMMAQIERNENLVLVTEAGVREEFPRAIPF